MGVVPAGYVAARIAGTHQHHEVLIASDASPLDVAASLGIAANLAPSQTSSVPTTEPDALLACEVAVPACEVAVVAGLNSGGTVGLPAGVHRLAHGYVVAVEEPVDAVPRPWHAVASRCEAIESAESAGATPSDHVYAMHPPVDPEPGPAVLRRPPRGDEPRADPLLEPPVLAAPPGEPAPLSWAAVLAPVPIGLVMAWLFRPLFAVFACMGPVLVLGRWIEQRRRYRRAVRERTADLAAARHAMAVDRRRFAEVEARNRWAAQPHVGQLRARAEACSVRLWERRPGHADQLRATIGIGRAEVYPVWSGEVPVDLRAEAERRVPLRSVPRVIDLGNGQGVGLYGDVAACRAIARSLVLQLTTLVGPADLAVGVHSSVLGDWDWLKWLPHLHEEWSTGGRFDIDARRTPVVVVIVDGREVDVAALQRHAESAEVALSVIAIASDPGRLPAACSTLVEVDVGGRVVMAGESALGVGASLDTAQAWASALGRVVDSEAVATLDRSLEIAPPLSELLEFTDAEGLQERWSASCGHKSLPFVLGIDEHGAATLDLVRDGPHALIAGTTGSGKSELLRTLVASLAASAPPEDLAFALFDLKGGGAFDLFDTLPHVVGTVTDLDVALIDRAVAGLRTELVERERRQRLGESVGRLIVVIDEFAVLAQEHPATLDALVDLAARGRSLGIHLVLATQKPSGAVDHRIRANTNLRIALRVQHGHESQDIVGTADAAAIDHRCPGRAIVAVAAEPPRKVQVCSARPAARARQGPAVVPFAFGDGPSFQEAVAGAPMDRDVATEAHALESLIELMAEQAASSPRRLWCPPLPSSCSLDDVLAAAGEELPGSSLAIGLADRVEERAHRPWSWDPATGPLAVIGNEPELHERLVRALLAGVLSESNTVRHAHVVGHLQGVRGSLGTAVDKLPPWLGAVIAAGDVERVQRLLTFLEDRADRDAEALVVFADLGATLAAFDELARIDVAERLETLVRNGARVGVHVVIGARSVRDLPHRIAQHLPNRLVGQLSDPTAHLVLGAPKKPSTGAGRVVDVESGCEVLVAQGPDLADLCGRGLGRDPAPRIEPCPSVVVFQDLAPPHVDQDRIVVPVGIEFDALVPAELELRSGESLLVVGPHGSGRSNLLEVLSHQLDGHVEVAPVGLAGRCSASSGTDIAAWIGSQQRRVVLVDDAARLDDSLAGALIELVRDRASAASVIVASTAEEARDPRSLAGVVRSAGSGVLLGAGVADSELFRLGRPRLPGLGSIAGRALLVRSGIATGVHLARGPVPREQDRKG